MASDGVVTIKVKADDSDVQKLVKSIDTLTSKLNAMSADVFNKIATGANKATSAVMDITDGMTSLTGESQKADSAMSQASSSAGNLARDVSDINGEGLFDVSKAADIASADLDGTSFAANNVAKDVADIDGEGLFEVSEGAILAGSDLDSASQSAMYMSSGMADIDGSSLDDVSNSADNAGDSIDKASQSTNKFSISLLDILKTAGALTIIQKGFDMIASSMDGAISRFDTMETYPRSMKALGYSTDEVDRSMRRLDSGIQGLPTKLDDVVSNTQRVASITGDLDKSTETVLALNNAFLASSASTADAKRGTEQYIQMLSSGRVDMQSWKTLQETMPYALKETAEAFGYTGRAAQTEFYQALRDGEITFEQFNSKLIELSEAQGGFAELAQTNSQTLRTSWENVKTAIVRGVANVIKALDELSKSITGNSIAQNLSNLKSVVDIAFSAMVTAIEAVSPVVEATISVLKGLLAVLNFLSPVIAGVVAGFATLLIIQKVSAGFIVLKSATFLASITMKQFAAGVALSNTALAGASTATKIAGTMMALFTGKLSAAAVATKLLGGAITFLSGPIGWVVAGIGALVAGLTLAWKWLGQASDEMKETADSTKEMADKTSELVDSIERSASAHEKNLSALEGQRQATNELVQETIELANAENLSAAEKEHLKANIESLNGSIEGLNLAYSEEEQALNLSNDAIQTRVDLMQAEEERAEVQQRLVEIAKERAEAEQQLEENSKKLDEAQRVLDESGFNWFNRNKEIKESVEELETANQELENKVGELTIAEEEASQRMQTANEQLAQAKEEMVQRGITSMSELEAKDQEIVQSMMDRYSELADHTTNMFDQISQKSHMSIEEMNENLRQNQAVVEEWSQGLDTLSRQGVDEGMLEQLRRLGPEGLPYVKELVDATPEKLAELESNFKQGGETAKTALFDSMGIDEGDMIKGIPELVTRTDQTLKESIEGSGIKRALPDALEESAADVEEAAAKTGTGAAIGLERGSGEVKAAAREMGQGLNDEFTAVLGIHSPSTVFIQHGQDITTGLQQGVTQGSSGVLSALRNLATQMDTIIQQATQKMNNTSLTGFTKLATDAQTNLNQTTTIVQTSMSRMTSTVQSESNKQTRIITTFYTDLTSRTRQNATTNETIHRTSWQKISTTTNQYTTRITTTIKSGTTTQVNTIRTGYNTMVSNIRSSTSQAVSVTRGAMNSCVSIMRSTAGQARSAGYNMGIGFRNGLASTRGSIIATARSIANSASSAIRSALRIHSPSRVTKELGMFTGEGLALGMKDKVKDVERVANQLANSAIPRMDLAKSIGGIGLGGSGSAVYNNQSFNFNATTGGGAGGMTREEMMRMFEEFKWYIKQEGGRLDG